MRVINVGETPRASHRKVLSHAQQATVTHAVTRDPRRFHLTASRLPWALELSASAGREREKWKRHPLLEKTNQRQRRGAPHCLQSDTSLLLAPCW